MGPYTMGGLRMTRSKFGGSFSRNSHAESRGQIGYRKYCILNFKKAYLIFLQTSCLPGMQCLPHL